MANPYHHQSIRKRARSEKEKYPSQSKTVRWVDRILIVAGVLTVVATIPQVLEVWVDQDASGVSTLSWTYYTLYGILFTIYGVIHKAVPIILNYSLATFLYAMIAVGSLIY